MKIKEFIYCLFLYQFSVYSKICNFYENSFIITQIASDREHLIYLLQLDFDKSNDSDSDNIQQNIYDNIQER